MAVLQKRIRGDPSFYHQGQGRNVACEYDGLFAKVRNNQLAVYYSIRDSSQTLGWIKQDTEWDLKYTSIAVC